MGRTPAIHPDARVAADATVTGDVSIGAGARIASGARLVAEPGSSISIGTCTIVLKNAVLRATQRQSLEVGDHCLIGPPDRHDEIWALQAPLDFPGYVYGVDRGEDHPMRAITEAMSARLGEVG